MPPFVCVPLSGVHVQLGLQLWFPLFANIGESLARVYRFANNEQDVIDEYLPPLCSQNVFIYTSPCYPFATEMLKMSMRFDANRALRCSPFF